MDPGWVLVAALTHAGTWVIFATADFSLEHANSGPVWIGCYLLLTLSQWAMLRCAVAIAGGHRRVRVVGDALLAFAVVLQLLVPGRVAIGYVEPTAAQATMHAVIAIVTTYATFAGAIVFWRAGRGMPSSVMNRSRALAIGTVLLYVSMLTSSVRAYPELVVFALIQMGAVGLLICAVAPPRMLRNAWQAPQLRMVLGELADVSSLTDRDEVLERLLPTIVRVASAQRATVHDADGRLLSEVGVMPALSVDAKDQMRVQAGDLAVELIGVPHQPFFAPEKQQLIFDLVRHLESALDRCRIVEREREAAEATEAANTQLLRANDELSELAALRDDFVAVASHELRTPITTIMGFSSTLLDLWDSIDEAARLEYLRLVDREAGRLGQLVEDLLLLSAVESVDFRVAREPVTVRTLLEEVIVDQGLDGGEIELVECEAGLQARADPRHLRQVVGNLVANALKHGRPPVQLRAHGVEGMVQIEVLDHGAGVPDASRATIFDRFSRGSGAESVPGSGLGLFIARRLVEVQGGRVWLAEAGDGGAGARFVVELPRAT